MNIFMFIGIGILMFTFGVTIARYKPKFVLFFIPFAIIVALIEPSVAVRFNLTFMPMNFEESLVANGYESLMFLLGAMMYYSNKKIMEYRENEHW